MWFRIVWERGGESMIGWLRRKRSGEPGGTGWSPDPAPTADERRDELLSAYLDDDLTAPEREELDARLETDVEFRDALDGMRTVRDTLATLEVVRAPRSFAITAPPEPARRGFRPLDLVTRVGAMAAAVAFVAVLAGDLSDSGRPPIVQDEAATSLSAEASGAAATGSGATEAAAGGAGDLTTSDLESAATPQDDSAEAASQPADGTVSPPPASTPEAPVLDAEATVQAAAATAARSATEEPSSSGAAAAPAQSDGADTAADDAGSDAPAPLAPNTGGALDPAADATPEPVEEELEASADPSSSPLELPQVPAAADDVTRVDDADAAGTAAAESALGTQSEETFAATANGDGANAFAEDGREVSSLAMGLGAAAAVLAAASGLLWWRRREGTAGPV